MIPRQQLILDLNELGTFIHGVVQGNTANGKISKPLEAALKQTIDQEIYRNGWYDKPHVEEALMGIREWLNTEKLTNFVAEKPYFNFQKQVSLILPGNLPLVGFHDVLCCLLMGCKLQIKMSSDDNRLLPVLVNALKDLNPLYGSLFELDPPKLSHYNAVIGTGSDSALLHFKSFFKHVPHLLRGNRTSIAILRGDETEEDLQMLGKDIFQYYGRGCRSVTHLIVPKGYSFNSFFEAIIPYSGVLQNKKYGNNYEYHRAIFLLSQQAFLDNNFLLLKETTDLHPPLGMVYYHHASGPSEVTRYLEDHRQQIQCIVGHDFLPFGTSQQPKIDDYADDINTLGWLSKALN